MQLRRFLIESGTLLASAVICATVSNQLADKAHKVNLVPEALPTTAARPTPAATVPTPEPTASAAPLGPAAATPVPSPVDKRSPAGSTAAASTPLTESRRDSNAAARAARPDDVLKRWPAHHQPYKEVHGEDVEALYGAGVLVIDARRSNVYAEGHIAGARSIPVWESDVNERITALLGEGRDGQAPVVIYCSGGDCEDSHMLAEKLFGVGFENLLVYKDGWPDWVKRGGKAAKGPA